MKKKTLMILFCCFFAANALWAQYRVIGFEGKDTVELGNTELVKGQIVLPKNSEKYTKVELMPLSKTYAEINKRLTQLKKAYSSNSTVVINAERNYIIDNLDFKVLYYSPLYRDYLQYWGGSYNITSNSKEQFASQFKGDIVKTLTRLVNQNEKSAAENLANDLTVFNAQFGFDNIAAEIVKYMQSVDSEFVNKNKNLKRILAATQLIEYKIPPKIIGMQEDTYKNCLIIFFDSDCDHCQTEIADMIEHYSMIEQRGIRVISIAADVDKARYEAFSASFPWKDKICDFTGLNGQNFSNYGVVGTPSMFLTDSEGKIIGNYPRFHDFFNDGH
jgi:peroxiredoxin